MRKGCIAYLIAVAVIAVAASTLAAQDTLWVKDKETGEWVKTKESKGKLKIKETGEKYKIKESSSGVKVKETGTKIKPSTARIPAEIGEGGAVVEPVSASPKSQPPTLPSGEDLPEKSVPEATGENQ
ncbi:MAG: hypothetical protein NTZ78_13275 [Candidatus Aureabacteria bacterium]|nr:hypothetical protein [Candidatus Auribacterota bacterium]